MVVTSRERPDGSTTMFWDMSRSTSETRAAINHAMKFNTLLFLSFLLLFTSCGTTSSTVTVHSADGRKRTLPNPQKFIRFQGSDFTIKSVSIKLQPKQSGATGVTAAGTTTPSSSPGPSAASSPGALVEAGVGEISFVNKFRDVTDLAVILDNAQFRDGQNLIAAASTLDDAAFNR